MGGYDAAMRRLLTLGVGAALLAATTAQAEPIVAIAPPAAQSATIIEAGLVMQAEAGRALVLSKHSEVHVKQLLRALARHRIDPKTLADPAVAARARGLLGVQALVFGSLTEADGKWTLEVRKLDDKGASAPHTVVLPAGGPAAIEAGAQALVAAVDPKLPAPKIGTAHAGALASYAQCYAILIRQPIAVDSPTVLAAADLDRAIKSCRAATAADPSFEAAQAALGLALAFAGQDADAVQALVNVKPSRYQPLYWLARYWLVTRYQSPDAGATALREVLKDNPGFLLARGYLAEHLVITGKLEEALAIWKDYSALLPKNAYLRGRVSSTLGKLGRIDEAIAIADGALALDRSDPDAVLELGSRYIDAKRYREAVETLQTAVSGRARGELFLRLGWAFFALGDMVKAKSFYQRAEEAAADPGEWRTRARARADLARLCDRLGDMMCARSAVERALDEGSSAYLHAQQDKRLTEMVATAEKTPRKSNGPRILRPAELSPFSIDPQGDVDVKTRQFPQPPPKFELLRF